MDVTPLSRSDASITPRLLRLKQGAAYLGCSYWTLRDLCLNGTVPVVRIPGARIPTGRRHGKKRVERVLVASTDTRLRSLRRVLVDVRDLDRLIDEWKGA